MMFQLYDSVYLMLMSCSLAEPLPLPVCDGMMFQLYDSVYLMLIHVH